MNPQDTQSLPNPLPEQPIFEIERHPIGVLGIYVGSAVLLIILAVVAFGVAPKYMTSVSTGQVYGIAAAAYFLFMFLVLGFVYIAHIVYWGNRWVLSNESLTQLTRTSLFDKQSSHLSLGNLQDVTAEQDGILQQLFHYGLLRVETAGERSKFVFPYCPNPSYYAQKILEAREQFEQGGNVVNNGLRSPFGSPAQYQPPATPAAATVDYQPVQQPSPQPAPTYPLPPQPPNLPSDYNDQPPTA